MQQVNQLALWNQLVQTMLQKALAKGLRDYLPSCTTARVWPSSEKSEGAASDFQIQIAGTWWVVVLVDHYELTHDIKAAQQSQGIQTLLEAEKDAAKTVQQARQCSSTAKILRHL